MTMIPLFALILAPNPPIPISDAQMQDLHCVAVIGIAAFEQRSKQGGLSDALDVREDGRRWAGIVGDRVMAATGQPREAVALAINNSVKLEQAKAATATETDTGFRERLTDCVAKMNANLGAIDAAQGAEQAGQSE